MLHVGMGVTSEAADASSGAYAGSSPDDDVFDFVCGCRSTRFVNWISET